MVLNICLLISWSIYCIDITLLLVIENIFSGIISYLDTLVFSNLAQLVLHCVFSFWFRLSDGSSAYISCIILTKDYHSLYSSSQSVVDFFFIRLLSLSTCYLITLLMVMAMLTSIIWTKGFKTLGSTAYGFSVVFTPLFLNILRMSLYLGKSIILCSISPHIWQEYLTSLYTLIC